MVLTALSGTTPAAGLKVSLYASEADALAATNALGTETTDASGKVTFTSGNTISLNIDGTQYDNISAGDTIELGLGLHAYKVVGDVNDLPSTDWEFFTVTDETTPGTVTVTLVEVPTTVDIAIYVKDVTNLSIDSLVLVNGATVE